MAIVTGRNASGQKVITGTPADLHNLHGWCTAMFVMAYGKKEGEERAKRLRFVDAVSLWSFDANNR